GGEGPSPLTIPERYRACSTSIGRRRRRGCGVEGQSTSDPGPIPGSRPVRRGKESAMADHQLPDPVVQTTGAHELARDLVVIPNRRVDLVPNIGVIGGDHSVLVVETGLGPGNAEEVLAFASEYAKG